EDGKQRIHEFSDKYPGYNFAETEAKFNRVCRDKETKDLGWPLCKTIHDHGSEHCETCPHFKNEQTPLHLALYSDHADEVSATNEGSIPGFDVSGGNTTSQSQPQQKPQLIVELGSKLWGLATKVGNEYRFGADQ